MLPGVNYRLKPKGYRQVSVPAATVVGLTIPNDADRSIGTIVQAIIVVETASVRYRDDGTDPTTSVGMLIQAGTVLEVQEDSLRRVRFIPESADAILNVSYYG